MKKLCFVAALVSAVAFAQEQQAPEPPCGGPGSCEQGKPCKFGRKGPRKGQWQCAPGQCGQEQCGPQQGPMRGPGFMGQMEGPWVLRFFSDPEKLEKAGVTDAAVREKIAAKAAELKAKGDELGKKIRDLSREQAMMMGEFIKNRSADAAPLLAKIDEIAKLRAEQGKLAVQSILALRENLTDEQIEAVKKFIFERGRDRMNRRGRGGMPPPPAPQEENR